MLCNAANTIEVFFLTEGCDTQYQCLVGQRIHQCNLFVSIEALIYL